VLPSFQSERIWSYFLKSLLIGLISLPIFAGAILLAFMSVSLNFAPLGVAVPLITMVLLVILFFRLSPILPGAAVAKPLSIKEAWAATRNAGGTIFLVAIISAIGSIVLDVPGALLTMMAAGWLPVMLCLIVSGWIKLMLGVSILTTLFGHYVEGRAITPAPALGAVGA
jgi:hypothetical protein